MRDYFNKLQSKAEPFWIENGYGTRFQEFQNLMRKRIHNVLLVSSLYDLYIFEEDGQLYDLLQSEYLGLHLTHIPDISRVSSGEEAVAMARENRYDLIITTLHVDDMRPATFAQRIRQEGLDTPVVMLAFDNRELAEMISLREDRVFDQVFIWQGNYQLILAIIKYLEDKLNVDHDTHIMGVQSLILVEDNIRYYSSFLPIIYREIMNQSRRVIEEGMNPSNKHLRQRARPKILHCTCYEEAWDYYEKYHETVLGIISDIEFPKNGKIDKEAGLKFARQVHQRHPDIPVLLHSSRTSNQQKALAGGFQFFFKGSPTLLDDLQKFVVNHLGFGEFIFRMPDFTEVGRAHDLISLEKELQRVPLESMVFHAERNHFSSWLKARTEFWLAHQVRKRKLTDFPTLEDTRQDLIDTLREYRRIRQRGIIIDFHKATFDPGSSISRIGTGSLGGKGRGLSFINTLINNYQITHQFDGVRVSVPPAVILATGIFDEFLDENDLRHFALQTCDDKLILERFLCAAKFPKEARNALTDFLSLVNKPLAVRSSSLLEDSHNHPFAGVYETFMLPNVHTDPEIRLMELIHTIKRVYASTFFKSSRDYLNATTFRLEEEKMAVIVQELSGSAHHDRYYPTFSGTARSFNFYPVTPQKSTDGIVSMAMGLGKMVVDGGMNVRFSPVYPKHILQFSNPQMALENNQHEFYALDLKGFPEMMNCEDIKADLLVKNYPVREAEKDDMLHFVASTYSAENDAIHDGISRPGVRVITFAPILKHELIPLPKILETLLDLGSWGMGTPVEIEFAVNMSVPRGEPRQFHLLQMRPMVLYRETDALVIDDVDPSQVICQSQSVLGNGRVDDIQYAVVVDYHQYDRAKSRQVADEVSRLNAKLVAKGHQYLLVGVGRWGSLDPWLGIPVTWDQIAGAGVIVESGFKDFAVAPSQGSHFFENLNSFNVGYFTVQNDTPQSVIDWDWLLAQPAEDMLTFTRLIRFTNPICIKMNGYKNQGVILKPGAEK